MNDVNPTGTRSTVLTTAEGEPSLGELVMGLTDDFTTLVRKEVALAKTEIQENVTDAAQAGGTVTVGGLVAYAGLLFILAAIAIGLGDWWENYWLSAAVVGVITALIGATLLNGGLHQLKQVSLVPNMAIHAVERDAKMAKAIAAVAGHFDIQHRVIADGMDDFDRQAAVGQGVGQSLRNVRARQIIAKPIEADVHRIAEFTR